MPEIKNVFTSGKMNKDLDERLVNKSEYRDALNIEVSTSDGSDVGSVQNTKGNTRGDIKNFPNGLNIIISGNPDNSQCIGSFRDTKNDMIYWFVAGTAVDVIAEYNSKTDRIKPVLVSVKSTHDVLKFNSKILITGINVIEGILFFTDGEKEPKRINIKSCKAGSINFSTHTKFKVNDEDKGNIKEEHITVIRKYPKNAPTLVMSNTTNASRVGTTTSQVVCANTQFVLDSAPLPVGTITGYIKFKGKPNYKVADKILLETSNEEIDQPKYQIRLRLLGSPVPGKDAAGTYIQFATQILSISPGLTASGLTWNATLVQEDSLFEKQFPRFAYRWKYIDGEYSALSPFSEPAFLPIKDASSDGVYNAADGYNLTMLNDLRNLVLKTFDTRPVDVTEIDIVIKQANSPVVYTVKTLKNDGEKEELDIVNTGNAGFEVKSEQVHAVLPSNQLLRPWDAVPRTAKAQEITKNRIIYGNYLQNFNMNGRDPVFDVNVRHTGITTANINQPVPSLKSIRTYQTGVVFLDEYGRQTPVLTHDSAIAKITQGQSDTQNILRCRLTNSNGDTYTAPDWATHYKYYIKEISNEYYNLAIDRFYTSEDGNVWLSFPSSDRNKVDLETYLILKKEHGANTKAINANHGKTLKYRILDIKNEAPNFLTRRKLSLGKLSTNFGITSADSSGFPKEGFLFFNVPGNEIAVETSPLKNIASDTVGDKYIRISNSSSSSEYYKISSIEPVNVGTESGDDEADDAGDYWIFTLEKPFGKDIAFTDSASGLSIEVFKEEDDDNKPEFESKFFVKISRDNYLTRYLISKAPTPTYSVLYEESIKYATLTQTEMKGAKGYFHDFQGFFLDKANFIQTTAITNNPGTPTIPRGRGTEKLETIELRLSGVGKAGNFVTENPTDDMFTSQALADFSTSLRNSGTLIRFTDDPDGDVYEIEFTTITPGYNWSKSNGKVKNRQKKTLSNHGIRYSIKLTEKISNTFRPETETSPSTPITAAAISSSLKDATGTFQNTKIQILKEVVTENVISSKSPAIFETEPKEAIDLDLYYETEQSFPIADVSSQKILRWHNCYSYGTGLESNRIRDDFNAVFIDKGPKVSTVLAEQYKEEHRQNGLIYSGIFNSTSGINRLNQFVAAEKITKDVNPSYGSIQKLYSRDSDLVVLCEDKSLRILAHKDALYNADGNTNLTATDNVLGQTIPFVGEYGISKNPESFATYAFRSYWVDKSRGSILRLSRDGLTNISDKGMKDYFSDNLLSNSVLPGSYDEVKDTYNITLKTDNITTAGDTVSFAENVNGWTSRKSFIPQSGISINNGYYTFYEGNIWKHNSSATYNSFYGIANGYSSVKFLFNDSPSSIKNFKTINYEGTKPKQTTYAGTIGAPGVAYTGLSIDEVTAKQPSLSQSGSLTLTTTQGWYCDSITTDEQSGDIQEFKNKEGKWFSNIHNKAITTGDLQTGEAAKEFAIQGIGAASGVATDGSAINGGTVEVTPTFTTSSNDLQSSPVVETFDQSGGAFTKNIVFTISATFGKIIKAADLSFTEGTSTPTISGGGIVDSNVTFVNTTTVDTFGDFSPNNKVTCTIPLGFTMLNANQAIIVNIAGVSSEPKNSIVGVWNSDEANTTGSSQANQAYSASGIPGSTVTLFTRSFTRDSGFDFNDLPPQANLENVSLPSNYEIVVADTGSGTSGSPLTVRTFTVKYTFPSESINNDTIFLTAKAGLTVATSTNQLYNFSLNENTLSKSGETRILSVNGDNNSQVVVDVKNASNNTIISGPVTLTVPGTGSIDQEIEFPLSNSTTTYTVTLTETGTSVFDMSGSFAGASGSAGSRIKTVTLNQRIDTTVTFTASTSNSSLTIDGSATSSSKTIVNKAEVEPDPVDELDLTYIINAGANGSVLANNSTSIFSFDNTKWTGTLAFNIKTLTNGTEVSFSNFKAVMLNNIATITGKALIHKYGTANDTTTMNIDASNFISVVATAPTATVQSVSTGFNVAKTITMAGTDPQAGTNLTFAITGNPSNGSLGSITEGSGLTSTVVYTPTTGYSGSDAFTFTVNDGTTTSSPASVDITVSNQSYAYSVDNIGDSSVANACSSWGSVGAAIADFTTKDYTFSQVLTDSDPGAGGIKFNSGSIGNPGSGSVTKMWVDDVDTGSVSHDSHFTTLANATGSTKGYIRIAINGSTTQYKQYTISGVTDKTGYWELTVHPTDHTGSLSPLGSFINGSTVDVTLYLASTIDAVYASTNVAENITNFYTDTALSVAYNPSANGISSAPNNYHRFDLGASGGNCGFSGQISSTGVVSTITSCC